MAEGIEENPTRQFTAWKELPLWSMTKGDKVQQKLAWQRKISEERQELADAIRAVQDAKVEIRELQDGKFQEVLDTHV